LLLASALLFGTSPPAAAQSHRKIPHIGFLSPLPSDSDIRAQAFRQGLRQFGYVEGRNIAIDYRHTEGNLDRAATQASELAHLNVDVIVAAGGDVLIRAAQKATITIPIVMMGQGSDPVAAGFIRSLARPGGNITGLANLTNDLGGKRLEVFVRRFRR
jgi:putative ABC transport system substrate-binding protein